MRLVIPFLVLLVVTSAHGGVIGKTVEYPGDSATLKGYISYDDKFQGKRPGIIIVHEWWGLNDYARKRADMLAELGYVALAVDMYGDGKQAEHPDDAGKFAGALMQNLPEMKARFMAGMNLLKTNELVDPEKIGAIGYCFGGGVVLTMAREGADLDGVVSFHGTLAPQSPAKSGDVKTKILVCTGAADPFIPAGDVKNFKAEMKAAGADARVISYPGAKHGFTNPAATESGKKFNLPLAYNASADKKSWVEMKTFFAKVFAK